MRTAITRVLSGWLRVAPLGAAALVAAQSPALAAQSVTPIRVAAEVESQEVYVGQPFLLQVTVEGDTRSQPPEIPFLDGFRVEDRGSSTSSEIVFDGTRTVERARRVFQYALTATKLGELSIPPIEVRTRDGVKRTEPVRVTVIEPGELDDFKLRLEVSDERVYAGEPVTLQLTWYLAHEVQRAAFSMPSLPSGFRMYSPADDGLTPAHFQSGQYFEVNFLGERSVARAGRSEIDGRQFFTLTIEKLLLPGEPGEFELGPATVAFTETSRSPRRSVFDNPLFNASSARTQVVASEAVRVSVEPLPTAGRPSGFSGLVGEYRVEGAVDRTEARVGDPITLTVTVRGEGPADEIPTLDLSGQPGFESAFKLTGERPTVEILPDGKRFTTMIRARSGEVTEAPPIELTYFDPEAGEYRTAASDPIPLRIEEADRVSLPTTAARSGGLREMEQEREDASSRSAPREVTLDDLSAREGGALALLRGPLGVALVSIPPAAALALAAGVAVARKRRADPSRARRM
ncbi:MAG: BatD family protein, partial [Phycisphaerales bacterium]